MADKARHAYGKSENLENALQSGVIDAYDILLLDGDTDPKVGWVDANGVVRIPQNKAQVVRVDELPTENGDENVVYIYNNECYVWNGTQCVSISKSADLTTLETQVSNIQTQMEDKVDAATVQSMISAAVDDSSSEVVEF